jgi:hypothetical protein
MHAAQLESEPGTLWSISAGNVVDVLIHPWGIAGGGDVLVITDDDNEDTRTTRT